MGALLSLREGASCGNVAVGDHIEMYGWLYRGENGLWLPRMAEPQKMYRRCYRPVPDPGQYSCGCSVGLMRHGRFLPGGRILRKFGRSNASDSITAGGSFIGRTARNSSIAGDDD
jgi:hypothetical protein